MFWIKPIEMGYDYGIVDEFNPAPEGAKVVETQNELDNLIREASEKVAKDEAAFEEEAAGELPDDSKLPPPVFKSTLMRLGNEGARDVNRDELTIVEFKPQAIISSDGDLFSRVDAGIQVNFNGLVKATLQLNFWTEGTDPQRATPHFNITIDKEPSGITAKHTYIRGSSGHNNSGGIIVEVYEVEKGQVIGASIKRGAVEGEVHLSGGEGSLLVERVG